MIFAAVCAAAVLVMALYYIIHGRSLPELLKGSLSGIAALVILNRFSGELAVCAPLNAFNVSGSAVLGVPYVIILVVSGIL